MLFLYILLRHSIHKNDPLVKPDLMVVKEEGSHHPQPQEVPYIDIFYLKMILRPNPKFLALIMGSRSEQECPQGANSCEYIKRIYITDMYRKVGYMTRIYPFFKLDI